MDQLTPGLVMAAKGTSSTGVTVWLGLCTDALPESFEEVAIVRGSGIATQTISLTGYSFIGDDHQRFYHGHQELAGLEQGQDYTLVAEVAGLTGMSAQCQFTTLPAAVDQAGLRVAFASCYDANNDPEDGISEAFGRICASGGRPHITVLAGDQVYLDAPWHEFRRFTRNDPRRFYLSKYWSTWGSGYPNERLGGVVSAGTNWFLPDDHEFWNNFPHATPLALHSFRNWRHILKARLSRAWHRITGRGAWPDSLFEPPDPSEWDTWSRAAFELFASFQTPASDGELSSGADDDQSEPPPIIPPVQHFDVAPARFVLVDSRTRRSRSARAPKSRFVDDRTISEIVRLASDPAAGLLFLVLAQPMFKKPRKYRGVTDRIKASLDTDRGLEDYPDQFIELWEQLVAARTGRPLILMAGDVHRSSVGVAEALSTVEVVSSPMALVSGVATLGRISRLWSGPTPDPLAGFELSELLPDQEGQLRRVVATEIEGIGLVELRATDQPDEFALTVGWQPRLPATQPPPPVTLVLRTGSEPGRPGLVSVANQLD